MRASLLRRLIEVIVVLLQKFLITEDVPQYLFIWVGTHIFKWIRLNKLSLGLLGLSPLTLVLFLVELLIDI